MAGFSIRIILVALIAVLSGPVMAQERATGGGDPLHVFMVTWRGETDVERGFRAHMREQGISIRYTIRDVASNPSRIPAIISEIRQVKPDLVHTWGTSVTLGIFGPLNDEEATQRIQGGLGIGVVAEPDIYVEEIPGVFSLVAYPVDSRIVQSLARPGRPLTGTSFLPPVETQIKTIRSYYGSSRIGEFKKVGVIYNPLESNSELNVEELKETFATEGIELVIKNVPIGSDGKPDASFIPALTNEIADEGVDFIYLGPDSFVGTNSGMITEIAADRGVPSFSPTENGFARSSALLGLVSNYYLVGKLAGVQAERILIFGERPEDLPVRALVRHTLLVRMSMARKFAFYPPISLLRVAQIVDETLQ